MSKLLILLMFINAGCSHDRQDLKDKVVMDAKGCKYLVTLPSYSLSVVELHKLEDLRCHPLGE